LHHRLTRRSFISFDVYDLKDSVWYFFNVFSGSESLVISLLNLYLYFPLENKLSGENGWDLINRFNPPTRCSWPPTEPIFTYRHALVVFIDL